MQGASIEELRELSRRSRRAQTAGFLGLLLALALVPVALVVPAWATLAVFATGGLAFVGYAYAVGQERGAFRRVFRRISEDKRATRRVEVEGNAKAIIVEAI